MTPRRPALLCLLLLGLGLLGACGGAEQPADGSSPAPRGKGRSLGVLSMQAPDGGTVEVTPPTKSTLTLVEVWSPTWFEGSDAQFERLQELHERWGNRGVRILCVAYDVGTEQVREAIERHGALFDVGLGDPGVYEKLDVQAIPTTWLLDREGRVLERLEGYQPLEAVERSLEKALAPEG